MDTTRVIVAIGNEAANAKVKSFLTENGYLVIDTAVEVNECLRKLSSARPDILVIDSSLPNMGGYEVAKVALEDYSCDVVMLTSQALEEAGYEFRDSVRFSVLAKPINKMLLVNTLELMNKSGKKIRQLEQEIADLKRAMDSRKEVDKAKHLLMKNMNMSEEEAFKRIQKQSMDKGISMKEIAKAIILAYDI
jgi:Response regulator with putative antiterminator output domain